MTITAKFASKCPDCGDRIEVGTEVEWVRGQKATHVVCPSQLRGENILAHRRELPAVRYDYQGNEVSTARDADDDSYDAWLARPVRTALAVEDAGVYVLPNGDIVKVQANREKTRTYAKRWVVINGERLTEADTRARGEYVYEAGLIQKVAAEARRMTLEEAKAFIIRYGICARCSRQLKAAASVEAGIGPICIQYFGGSTTGAAVISAPAVVEETKPVYEHWDHRGEFCHVTDYFCSRHGYARCTACPDAPQASVQAPQAQIDDSDAWEEQGTWTPTSSPRSGSDWRARRAEQKGAWQTWTSAVGRPPGAVGQPGRWSRPGDDELEDAGW